MILGSDCTLPDHYQPLKAKSAGSIRWGSFLKVPLAPDGILRSQAGTKGKVPCRVAKSGWEIRVCRPFVLQVFPVAEGRGPCAVATTELPLGCKEAFFQPPGRTHHMVKGNGSQPLHSGPHGHSGGLYRGVDPFWEGLMGRLALGRSPPRPVFFNRATPFFNYILS